MVKYSFFLSPISTSERKTSMAENVLTKDGYMWDSSLDIPPNETIFNNQEWCGGENWVSARSVL